MPNDFANMVTKGTGVRRYKTAQSAPPTDDIATVPPTDDMEAGAEESMEESPEAQVQAIVDSVPPEHLQMLCDMAQAKLNSMNNPEGSDMIGEEEV